MKKFIIAVIGLSFLFSSVSYAQKKEDSSIKNLNISLDLMSRYVWRGTDYGKSPSIQPGISYSLKGFTIGTWGAFTTNNPGVQETDIYLSYTIKELVSLTVTDYFFPDDNNPMQQYFDYSDTTGHVFEGSVSFNGTEKIPLTFLLAMNFYGADARRINDDGSNGSLQYSTYAELGYTYKNLNAFIGFNLTNPDTDKGESGFYGNKAGIVNLGIKASKDIQVTDKFSLPLNISLITNPQAEKIFLVAGFSF